MTGVIAIVLAGLTSYALRATFTLRREGSELPAIVVRASSLIAPAAFAGMCAAALFGELRADLAASIPLVGGLIAAAIGVVRTGSASAALITGFPVIWLLSTVL